MMTNAEKFLVQCVATQEALGTGVTSFDVLRHFVFHNRYRSFYIRREFFQNGNIQQQLKAYHYLLLIAVTSRK